MNTYVVRNTDGTVLASRASGTMHYTHAVVDNGNGAAYSWHLTEAAARKASQSNPGTRVAPVEEHKGGKATVLKRLAQEATDAAKEQGKVVAHGTKTATVRPAKATPKATPAKAAKATKATGPTHPGSHWLAVLEEANLSQTQAAKVMGVAPMTLNRLVNGQGIPTAKVTVAFAQATGQDVQAMWSEVAAYELAVVLAAK